MILVSCADSIPPRASNINCLEFLISKAGHGAVEGGAGVGLTSSTDRLVLKLILSRDLN